MAMSPSRRGTTLREGHSRRIVLADDSGILQEDRGRTGRSQRAATPAAAGIRANHRAAAS